jgi:hypothetical protein
VIGRHVRLRDATGEDCRTMPTFLLGKTGTVVAPANKNSTWFHWHVELDDPGDWLQNKVWANERELEVLD